MREVLGTDGTDLNIFVNLIMILINTFVAIFFVIFTEWVKQQIKTESQHMAETRERLLELWEKYQSLYDRFMEIKQQCLNGTGVSSSEEDSFSESKDEYWRIYDEFLSSFRRMTPLLSKRFVKILDTSIDLFKPHELMEECEHIEKFQKYHRKVIDAFRKALK